MSFTLTPAGTAQLGLLLPVPQNESCHDKLGFTLQLGPVAVSLAA